MVYFAAIYSATNYSTTCEKLEKMLNFKNEQLTENFFFV